MEGARNNERKKNQSKRRDTAWKGPWNYNTKQTSEGKMSLHRAFPFMIPKSSRSLPTWAVANTLADYCFYKRI